MDITLPWMEDKPKSLNTQRDKGPLINLKDSWITHELRRITLLKIEEIKCWQKERSLVILNDDQALMKTKCLVMQMLSCKIK